MKRNNTIALLKFLSCIIIVILHSNKWNGTPVLFTFGSILVDFFFITSGFLLVASIVKIEKQSGGRKPKNLGLETFKFVFKKYLSFLPYIVLAYILCLIFRNFSDPITLERNIKSIFDLFLFNMFTYPNKSMLEVTWYLSSMLFAMLILYPLIRKYKDTYFYIIAPVILILLLTYMSYNFTSIKVPTSWANYFTYRGNLRAFLDLSLGTIVYKVVDYIKEIKFKKWFKVFLTIIEIVGYLGVLLVLTNVNRYDYLSIFIIAGLVGLSFSNITYTSQMLPSKITGYLEKLSLPIYIFQELSVSIIKLINIQASAYITCLIYVLIAVALGIAAYYIVMAIKKINFKKLIIDD